MEPASLKLEACGLLITGIIHGPFRSKDPDIVMDALREEIEHICQHGYPNIPPPAPEVCKQTREFLDRMDSKLRGVQYPSGSDKEPFST